MMLKKFFVLLLPVFITAYAPAQTVKVKKDKSTVNGKSMEGYAVELQGAATSVNKSMVAYLKGFGKVRQSGAITLTEAKIRNRTYAAPVYATTTEDGKTTTAWVGLDPEEWAAEDAEKMNGELENFIRDFGVRFYREQIQLQIDESVRAEQAVGKQQQRLVNENKMLNTRLDNNKKEKIRLEKELEQNKIDHETLLKKIEQNKKSQDSVAVASEQVKKMVEMHKERQKKVN